MYDSQTHVEEAQEGRNKQVFRSVLDRAWKISWYRYYYWYFSWFSLVFTVFCGDFDEGEGWEGSCSGV